MTNKQIGVAFLVVGVLLFLVALTADTLGLGSSPGLGMKQVAGAVVGVVIAAVGMRKVRRTG